MRNGIFGMLALLVLIGFIAVIDFTLWGVIILGILIVGGLVILLLPEIKRYLRIKSM